MGLYALLFQRRILHTLLHFQSQPHDPKLLVLSHLDLVQYLKIGINSNRKAERARWGGKDFLPWLSKTGKIANVKEPVFGVNKRRSSPIIEFWVGKIIGGKNTRALRALSLLDDSPGHRLSPAGSYNRLPQHYAWAWRNRYF